jgi:hypothetical protein
MRLTVTIATASTPWTARTRGIAVGLAKGDSTESASTAAPTESVAAPVTEMSPFMPTSTPGVMSPWTARSAAMSANPPATTTVLESL